jgi:hypothetical protein
VPQFAVDRIRVRDRGHRHNEDPLDERPNQPDPTPPGAVTWIAFAVIVALLLLVLVALSLSQGENPTPTTISGSAAEIMP